MAFLILAGIAVALVILAGIGGNSSGNKPGKGTVKASIAVSSSALKITNTGSADWSEGVVYINGTPPFTYKGTFSAPAVGKSVTVALTECVNRDGERFNPYQKAVTEIWLGGSGFDYEQRTVSR